MTKQPRRSFNVIYQPSELYAKHLTNLASKSERLPGLDALRWIIVSSAYFADCMRSDGDSEL